MRNVALALVHYPVVDRGGSTVTTAITNLDLHDISRSAYTYGIERTYIVHPVAAQRELAERICRHWTEGSGARRIPDRSAPLATLRIVDSLSDAISDLASPVQLWATSARSGAEVLGHAEASRLLRDVEGSVLILFGTGWGLAPEVLARARHLLAPINSVRQDGYNHLSVRAAVAILLDRLLGSVTVDRA